MTEYGHNMLGFTCLGKKKFKQLFGYEPVEPFDPVRLESRKLKEPQPFPDKPLPDIPKLPYGKDIEEYFAKVAQNFFDYWKIDERTKLLLSISKSDIQTLKSYIPKFVKQTKANVWTKIDLDGDITEIGQFEPSVSVFDTETFVLGSDCNSPIVAQALGISPDGRPALYMWLHECFDKNIKYKPTKVSVGRNKMLVAHNASFDRMKVLETYTLEQPSNIYLCTMAMMQLVGGVDASQRWALNVDPLRNYRAQQIQAIGCKLGLVPSYEFMLKKSLPEGAKEPRNVFVKAKSFSEFREKRQVILEYSMLDVIYNLELFQAVYPKFLEHSNHKAILAGQSIIIDSVVPHIPDWDEWVERCDLEYQKTEKQIFDILLPYVSQVHDKWLKDGIIPNSLKSLNWDYVRPYRHRKDKPLPDDWELRAKWFEPWRKGKIKLKGKDIGILLQCEFLHEGLWRPVLFTNKDKFHIIHHGKVIKLPNRKNPGENFGNILGSDGYYFATKTEPELQSTLLPDYVFHRVLKLVDKTSTYVGFRNRVGEQNKLNGIVACQVNPAGTVSGRSVSSLYNTLPAHWDEPKIMSEIKMTSQCPEGYVFVGGDADQQESSVAAAMADSYYGVSGASEFAKAVLAGTKAEGTDIHSMNAKNVTGKSKVTSEERYGGKSVGFGLTYGAGVKTTAKTIAFNYGFDWGLAIEKAKKAVSGFKGDKQGIQTDQVDQVVLPTAAFVGGLASDVFNKMTDIIRSQIPTGLFFGNEWPKSLQPRYCRTDSSPPQLNYCIQASCSTYGFLSAWVASTMDEIRRNNIDARFGISVHDEIFFICKEKDAKKLAYWIMICYARTWALLHHNLYIGDMPVVRAFPSSISIDKILRKSPTASTKTPTFPESDPGKEVTIFDFVE